MKKAEAIKRAGSAAKLARLLGITPQAVSKWPDEMPPLQVYRLKEIKPRWFRRAVRQSEDAAVARGKPIERDGPSSTDTGKPTHRKGR